MRSALALARDALGGAASGSSDRARGTLDGHEIEVRLVDRGVGSTRDPWVEIVVLGAAGRSDLHLHVIPQTSVYAPDLAEGLGTDVVLGDARFDDAYLVEAAPADVVRHVFDDAVRARMVGLARVVVRTSPEGLRIERAEWPDDAQRVRDLAELGIAIARRVEPAFVAAEREHRARGAYRGGAASTSALEEARRAEVAGVVGRTERRAARSAERGCMLALAVLLVTAALVAAFLVLVALTGAIEIGSAPIPLERSSEHATADRSGARRPGRAPSAGPDRSRSSCTRTRSCGRR